TSGPSWLKPAVETKPIRPATRRTAGAQRAMLFRMRPTPLSVHQWSRSCNRSSSPHNSTATLYIFYKDLAFPPAGSINGSFVIPVIVFFGFVDERALRDAVCIACHFRKAHAARGRMFPQGATARGRLGESPPAARPV